MSVRGWIPGPFSYEGGHVGRETCSGHQNPEAPVNSGILETMLSLCNHLSVRTPMEKSIVSGRKKRDPGELKITLSNLLCFSLIHTFPKYPGALTHLESN